MAIFSPIKRPAGGRGSVRLQRPDAFGQGAAHRHDDIICGCVIRAHHVRNSLF
jgi:hypothetical protein